MTLTLNALRAKVNIFVKKDMNIFIARIAVKKLNGVSNMEELKKCPFCGGEARIKMERKNNVGWTIWCECKKCYAKAEGYCPSMQNADNALNSINTCKINAIEAWNRRWNK